MIRVLQKTATLGSGGIQKILVELQKNMDRNVVQYDYFLNLTEPDFYTDEVLSLGGKIYGRKHNVGNPVTKIIKRNVLFYKTIKENGYQIVHIDETLEMTAISVLVARLAGVKVIIAHSHNDHASEKIKWCLKYIIDPIARWVNSTFATDYFACSQIAAKWLFTERLNEKGIIKIINNGINAALYEFDPNTRKEVREKLGIENNFVIGHVGRFYKQKNHKFILDTFSDIVKQKPEARLLLIGEGELKDSIKAYAEELGISDSVIFYGLSNEVNKLLQAFDAFVFPSIFEGLGIVAVEAQAASVQTFCAEETIAKEVNITPYCHYIPLSKGHEYWAKSIIEIACSYERKSTTKIIQDANFDIVTVAKDLETFYVQKVAAL